mmetsp:Transcript_50783/g.110220  ORF Transcript_50783/g.110220 Transcript_50783/m.110220 type:complete len:257 (+) Transcript_50783:520-1290(+)
MFVRSQPRGPALRERRGQVLQVQAQLQEIVEWGRIERRRRSVGTAQPYVQLAAVLGRARLLRPQARAAGRRSGPWPVAAPLPHEGPLLVPGVHAAAVPQGRVHQTPRPSCRSRRAPSAHDHRPARTRPLRKHLSVPRHHLCRRTNTHAHTHIRCLSDVGLNHCLRAAHERAPNLSSPPSPHPLQAIRHHRTHLPACPHARHHRPYPHLHLLRRCALLRALALQPAALLLPDRGQCGRIRRPSRLPPPQRPTHSRLP